MSVSKKNCTKIYRVLKKKTMKTEKTKKLKRVKKDADIPESLEGEPSGSDLQIPVTPYEIVWVRISLLVSLFLTIKFLL